MKKIIARLWTSFRDYCRLFYNLCQIGNRILEKCDYLAPKFSENATLFQCYCARGLLMLKVNSVCQKAKFYSLLCYSTVEIKRLDKRLPNYKKFTWYIYLRHLLQFGTYKVKTRDEGGKMCDSLFLKWDN